MPSLTFSRSASPEDEFELKITSADENSSFSVEMYVSTSTLQDFAGKLSRMRESEDFLDFQFGRVGHEFAGGSAALRFHTRNRTVLVTSRMQGRYAEFGRVEVAAEAILYTIFSAAAFDSFKSAIADLANARCEEAVLLG